MMMGVIKRFRYYPLVALSLTRKQARELPIYSGYPIKIGYVLVIITPHFAITDFITS